MNFFKTKAKTPPEIVRNLRDSINRLDNGGTEGKKKVSPFGFHVRLLYCSFTFHRSWFTSLEGLDALLLICLSWEGVRSGGVGMLNARKGQSNAEKEARNGGLRR